MRPSTDSVARTSFRRGGAAVIALMGSMEPAAAQIDAQALGDFITANLSSVTEGEASVISPQWCFTMPTDPWTRAWQFTDPLSKATTLLSARNAFEIPFLYVSDARTADARRIGAIVVGYELDAANPGATDNGQRLASSGTGVCSLGPIIVAAAPWTIVEVGSNGQLAEVAQIDPAPEYHWWHVLRHTLRVRFLQRMPVTYLVNGRMVPGYVIVAFNH